MDHVVPLKLMRERSVAERRKAAESGFANEVARIQGEIDAVDRAIAQEELAVKAARRPLSYENL